MATRKLALCRHDGRHGKPNHRASARSLSLIPLLTDGQHNIPLQEIIVNGKRREKAYLRGLAISKQEPTAIIVPYNKRETFNYTQVIPYQPWMANAPCNW